MELRDKVLACVKMKGPVIPLQVAKEIAKDTFYAGALLSELLNNKIIKISHAKIGGSPVYYMQGQEEKLTMLFNSLPQKEKEAYNLLKEKKILKDEEVEPAIRVALRMIKDFAIPSYDSNQDIVWRWYLHQEQKIAAPTMREPRQAQQQYSVKQQEMIPQTILQTTTPQPMKEKIIAQQPIMQQPPREKIVIQQEKIQTAPQVSPQPSLVKEQSLGIRPQTKIIDAFTQIIHTFLRNNHINIVEEKIIKKNKELEIIAKVPSNVGLLEYVILAKNKKKITDGDLSLAHNQGQLKKMPVILLTNGQLSKKANEYREKNLKGFMVIKTL